MAYVQYSLTISESQVNQSIWLGGGIMVTDDFFTEVWVNTTPIGNKRYYEFPTAGTYIIRCFLKDETCIKRMCFSSCEMTDVIIPNTVKVIEIGAFNDCEKLKTVLFEENSQLTVIEGSAFTSCFKLEFINFPNTLRRIGSQAFGGCYSLKSIELPYSVITIDGLAFHSCNNLNYIQCLGKTAPIITDTTFKEVATNGLLVYPEGSDYSQWLSTDKYYLGYYGWRSGTHGDGQNTPIYPNGTIISPEGYRKVDRNGEIFNYVIESTNIQWWGIYSSPIWINGEGDNGSYSITVDSNTDTIDREASIKFNAYDYNGNLLSHILTINQEGNAVEPEPDEPDVPPTPDEPTPYIEVSPTSINLKANGSTVSGSDEITVTWNGNFTYSDYVIKDNWVALTIARTSSTEDSQIVVFKVLAMENTGGARNTTIDFVGTLGNGENISTTFTINQEGNAVEPDEPEIPEGEIITPDTTKIVSSGASSFKYHIEANNMQYLFRYYTYVDWLTVSMIDAYNYNIVVAENSGDERKGVVYFEYVDNYGTTFRHSLTITQEAKAVEPEPDEPDVPPTPDEPEVPYVEPEIRLNKTRLDYSSEGGEQRVQIDYYGATSILEPTCSQKWVTVKKSDDDFYYEGDVRVDSFIYTVTMESSTFARNTNITFSCTDANDKVFKDSHLTLYQAAPIANPSIVVSKNQMSFDNVGDTNTVQVTYINVDEIIPPTAPEGFEIEESERVESEDGIQIRYQIKRVSAKVQDTTINFQGSNSEGKTATSSNVNISSQAIPAEFLVDIFPKEGDVFMVGEDGNDSTLELFVYGYTGKYDFSYKINGDSSAIFVKKEDVWDSEDEDAHVYFELYFGAIPNNTNNPFTGTIDLFYKDDVNNYTTSVPFKVRYLNEGKIEANIERYNYNKDGNNTSSNSNNYFAIRYYNMATINHFECDYDWIQIGEPELKSQETANPLLYYYSLSVQPNSGISRTGYVTFSGKGIDGKSYSLELEINQEGTEVVKPVDEGFIELQQLSVELMADGGAQTFQVKYYDTITVNPPELQYDWATITEVSRTSPVPDVAWNGEECESFLITYRVTAQPTESGRQMKVTFTSEINGYNGSVVNMWNDKFIVYQLAEGSTEVQGSVSILRYSKSFTYYGTASDWNFRVGYKNVTPDTPRISESWCRIGEVINKTSDEYDFYREYVLDMDTNNSPISRTCTITFIGNAEDGSNIETPFQFTQQGQEEIVNEGEYDNYKGYFMDFEGALHSVSFITNPRIETFGDIRLAGDSPVVVSYSENDNLYEPIRTSTCTVKVVSSHYLMNLYSGKAQGTQVILKNEDMGTIEWCGFLQPNLYNQGFSDCIEEIEFEASDCLSTMQYIKYEYEYMGNGQPMIVSFKDIVDSIAEKCKLISSYRFTQKLFSNSDESKIFDFKEFYISENNFYSEEGEPWTYQEVLEEICKYFGFVCFQWGDKLYFMDFDKYQSTKSMVGYSYNKEDGWLNRSYITLSNSNQITEDSYRGTGADISLDDVFNKVTVNCNYYNVEDIIPDLFEDDYLTERNGISITTLVNRGQEVGSRSDYIIYDHKNIISHFYKPIVGKNIHEQKVTPTEEEFDDRNFFRNFVGANIVDMYHLDYGNLSGRNKESKEWERYLMISQLNRPWCQHWGYTDTGDIYADFRWPDYNLPIMEFTQLPQIFIDNNKEVYASTSTGSTGGRVPSTGSPSGNTVPRTATRATTNTGFGSSSTTSRHDRNNNVINVNKSEHYLVINAEAAFSPDFAQPYIPDGVDQTGFGKWSNDEYGGFTFDHINGPTKDNYSFNPALTFYLEIPQVGWWNGTKWVDYETWFEVPLEALHYTNEVWYTWKRVENKVDTTLFLSTTGYKIALPKDMESTAFMQFKIGMPKRFAHIVPYQGADDTGTGGNAYCFIKDLEMKIVSRNSALMKDDEDIVYENVIDDGNVVDGPEIDLKITSDNNITYSFSTVSTKYGEELKPTTNFRFYDMEGELILPEEAIVERYVKQYSTPTLKENVTVDMSFTPAQMITDTYWDKDFVIVGQEIDYQMCTQEITLLEKK